MTISLCKDCIRRTILLLRLINQIETRSVYFIISCSWLKQNYGLAYSITENALRNDE